MIITQYICLLGWSRTPPYFKNICYESCSLRELPSMCFHSLGWKIIGGILQVHWWVSKIIPRFTKMFEYWKICSVIVFGIENSAFSRNLSPWARSRAEKSHQTFRSLRLGEVPFKISFLENAWYHRNQRSTEQYFTQGHVKIIAFSSVFCFLKFSYLGNWEP